MRTLTIFLFSLIPILSFQFVFADTEIQIEKEFRLGEIKWIKSHYLPTGTGVIRVIDLDMNFNHNAIDSFEIRVWSDTHAKGIDLTVHETRTNTGVFEGTVFFNTVKESEGHRLKVSDKDTVYAKYEDNTLPDEYSPKRWISITAETYVGKTPYDICNDYAGYGEPYCKSKKLRVVDAFGNLLDIVKLNQHVQIQTDVENGKNIEQSFVYLIQIKDENGIVTYLNWIKGSLSSGQSFSPALSWIPEKNGHYFIESFVWNSIEDAIPIGIYASMITETIP